MPDGHVTENFGQYPAINEIGRARQANPTPAVWPRMHCESLPINVKVSHNTTQLQSHRLTCIIAHTLEATDLSGTALIQFSETERP